MDKENQETIDHICTYAEQHKIKAILQEYLRRLVVDKPADPLSYLIKTVQENPFEPPADD